MGGIEGNARLSSPNVKEQVVAANFIGCSNWTSLTRFIQPAGVTMLAHCCTKAFVEGMPGLDFSIVFKGDPAGTIFTIDNYTEGKRGEDLKIKESIQKSDIYCKLFKVEPLPS